MPLTPQERADYHAKLVKSMSPEVYGKEVVLGPGESTPKQSEVAVEQLLQQQEVTAQEDTASAGVLQDASESRKQLSDIMLALAKAETAERSATARKITPPKTVKPDAAKPEPVAQVDPNAGKVADAAPPVPPEFLGSIEDRSQPASIPKAIQKTVHATGAPDPNASRDRSPPPSAPASVPVEFLDIPVTVDSADSPDPNASRDRSPPPPRQPQVPPPMPWLRLPQFDDMVQAKPLSMDIEDPLAQARMMDLADSELSETTRAITSLMENMVGCLVQLRMEVNHLNQVLYRSFGSGS